MIRVLGFPLSVLRVNCYVLLDTGARRAVVIDPGLGVTPLLHVLQDVRVEAVLLTHGHFDHIAGVGTLRSLTGAPVHVHADDALLLGDPQLNLSLLPVLRVVAPDPDVTLRGGETLAFLGQTIEVLHTPGHSPGSVCYRLGDLLFTGDTLEAGKLGRTDLPGSDRQALARSLRERILPLPPSTRILPGHGMPTDLATELRTNPDLRAVARTAGVQPVASS